MQIALSTSHLPARVRHHTCVDVGRAVITENALGIPAGGQADPVSALGTLAEVRLGFLNGFAEGLVMGWTQNGALDFPSAARCSAEHATKETASSMEGACGHAGGRGFELAHKAVTAAVAEKFELKAFVGRMVMVIARELN